MKSEYFRLDLHDPLVEHQTGIHADGWLSGSADVNVRIRGERLPRRFTVDFLSDSRVLVEVPTGLSTTVGNLNRRIAPLFHREFLETGVYLPEDYYDQDGIRISDPGVQVPIYVYSEFHLQEGTDWKRRHDGSIPFGEVNQLRIRIAREMVDILKDNVPGYEYFFSQLLSAPARNGQQIPVVRTGVVEAREVQNGRGWRLITIKKSKKRWFGHDTGEFQMVHHGTPEDDEFLAKQIERMERDGWTCEQSSTYL